MRKLIIDGDIIVYRFACSTEQKFEWDTENPTYVGDVEAAVRLAQGWLDFTLDKLEADDYVFCFSDRTARYFRHDLLPDYKIHRTHGRPPVHRHEVTAKLKESFNFKEFKNLEGDDVMGILATAPGRDERIMVSLDKDMKTIPGLHYNYHKDDGIHEVSPEQADYNHLFQTLTGDTCDGFKGCPGIGPKKAAKILVEPTWASVVAAYEKKGLTEADALVQARMARILRHGDYNTRTHTVKLWKPNA